MQPPSWCKRGGTQDLGHQGLSGSFAGRALPDQLLARRRPLRQPRYVTSAAQPRAHGDRADRHPQLTSQHRHSFGRQRAGYSDQSAEHLPRGRSQRRCQAANESSSSGAAGSNGSAPEPTAAAGAAESGHQVQYDQNGAGEPFRPPPKVSSLYSPAPAYGV